MKRRLIVAGVILAPCIFIFALLMRSSLTAAGTSPMIGEAFGVGAATGAAVVKQPHVVLPANGGDKKDKLAELPPVNLDTAYLDVTMTADQVGVSTSGVMAGTSANVTSTSTVENLYMRLYVYPYYYGLIYASYDIRIQASHLVAKATSSGNGSSSASRADGSAIVGLTVNYGIGVQSLDTVAPNTEIMLPGGFGRLILNEQAKGGNGITTTSITVNMIHLELFDPMTGEFTDIVVGAAQSGLNFQ